MADSAGLTECFPCESKIARVTCSCTHPGSSISNGYTCSDPAYNDRCGWGRACMPPVGHAFSPSQNPRGWQSRQRVLHKLSVYSRVSREHPCSRTLVEASPEETELCKVYGDLELIIPDCSTKVRELSHESYIGLGETQKTSYTVWLSPQTRRTSPTGIATKQLRNTSENSCGLDARRAYECLLAPSFRADLFRFCALYADGGVYMDEDIVPLHSIDDIVSECASATIGHDFPAGHHPAKQMKILASAPKAPIISCAVNSIISAIRVRAHPSSPLGLTGPLMLQNCYTNHSYDVAITYIDTRGAIWPFTGMRAGNTILAYEYPDSPKHFCSGEKCDNTRDYAQLFKKGEIYSPDCKL